MLKLIPLLIGLTFLVSCQENSFHEDKIFVGGIHAPAAKLNKGKYIYQEYCMACHGERGDGKGVAAKGLVPPPRDFTLGIYKFGKVISGELPHDSHLKELIVKGLHGTAMLPWDMSDGQLDAVVQYIKTFAPDVWENKSQPLADEIVVTKDPYGLAHKSSAIQRGKEVYHIEAQCQSCHRAYVSRSELSQMNQKINNEAITVFDEEMYTLKLQDSEHNAKFLPPDFTWHEIRSAQTVEELYVRLAAGVGGTSMPSWKDVLEDSDIWAVAHYVKHLMDMKDKPSRKALMERLK